MALLGIYVGVIPVSLGMLWLPFLRRLGRRWIGAVIAFTVGLLAFLAVDAGLEGLEIAAAAPAAFGGASLVFLGALAAYLALAGIDAYLSQRGQRARAAAARGGRRLPGAAGRDRDRPPQPRRGAGDRLRLRDRGARPRRLPGRRLRDPQHHRGAGDRRAAARRGRRQRRAAGALPPARARPDRRRPGDPRRLDRRRRLQPEPGGAAVRRRRRRDRPGDRPDRADDARRGGPAALPGHGRRDARRDRRHVPDRAAGVGLMAANEARASARPAPRRSRTTRRRSTRSPRNATGWSSTARWRSGWG